MPTHSPAATVILLADDEVMISNLVRLMLTEQRYIVLTAPSGVEAIEICRKFTDPIHLLVTNINMPEMDGIALAAALRKQRPTIKVVMMSGDMDESILEGNRPDAFLKKPFMPKTLLKTIQEVLDGERPQIAEI